MSTEFTGCGIDVPSIFPSLCTICVKDCYLKGGRFEVPDPDGKPDELVLDSDDLLDTALDVDENLGIEYPDFESDFMDTGSEAELQGPAFDVTDGGSNPPAPDALPAACLAEMSDEELDTAYDDLEWKNRFAERERQQEEAAFLSDPDYKRSLQDVLNEHEITVLRDGRSSVLELFPAVGKFEDNIYRPSAVELAAALPDWTPTVEQGQLVLVKEIGTGSKVKCWTSIRLGEIAGGTGEDSIRIVREDTDKNGKVWRFKNNQDWVTRTVPKDKRTPKAAATHLAEKVEGQVTQFVRTCPSCGKPQVKCKRAGGFWWKGTDCRCKVEGGW